MSSPTESAAAASAAAAAVQRVSRLSQLSPALIGTTVKLHGWIYSTRTQGAGSLQFLDLGDGSSVTPTRCIAERPPDGGGAEGEEDGGPPAHHYYYGSTNLLAQDAAAGDETEYGRLSFDELTQASSLSVGCSVMLFGYVAEPPPGTTQSHEIRVIELFLIGGVDDASRYAIQKSVLKKPLALRGLPHARFRAPLVQQLMRIRSEALYAVHEFFHGRGVPLLDPNVLTASDCEGAGEIFKVTPQFFHHQPAGDEPKKKAKKGGGGKDGSDEAAAADEEAPRDEVEEGAAVEVGLTVSSQLPLEAIAMGTGAVYTCQKSFRAEKSDTNKHLAEFLHIEYEEYFINLDGLLDQAEAFVKHVIRTVVDRCREQYDFLDGRATAPPEFHGHRDYLVGLLDKPFVRITHAEAIDAMLQDLRDKVKTVNAQGKEVKLKFKEKQPRHGEDLSSEMEKYLVQKYGTFVFVTHWPSAIKSFYMKQCGDGTCEAFDLLAPLVGELFGGSMREWRRRELETVMKGKRMDFRPLQWFVDLRGDGTAPHGGWGMGFDRLVMFLTNAQSVRDVVPYPVYYGHCPY